LPGTDKPADMRVIYIYRRDGNKPAENWVIIDILHWRFMLGNHVLARGHFLSASTSSYG
jgi:hypothetical protein